MKISVLQWNIWYREDIKRIASFLLKQQADIICLQELTVNYQGQDIKDTPSYIAEQLGYHYYVKELPIESTDGQRMMLANGIFSRFPLLKKRFAWINEPKENGGYDDEYRAYVEVTVDTGSTELTIGTTHMSYTHRFEVTKNKKHETDTLMRELEKPQNKIVFTGDLNAAPGSYTVNAINQLLKNASPDFAEKTWTTKPFSYNGFEESNLNWRLDYIFASDEIKMTSTKILKTQYSDHLPVLSTFDI